MARPRRGARRGGRRADLAALALVLASAALHAGWNALVAGAADTHATTAVALVFGALVFAIPAALTWRVEADAWPYIVASAALELVVLRAARRRLLARRLLVRLSDRARLGARCSCC